ARRGMAARGPMATTDFGPYELRKKIGTGGMTSVYLAVQKSLGRSVVLKILHPHLTGDAPLTQRFRTEARAVASLSHENIVGVIDFGEFDGMPYIAMEFVQGSDLRVWLDTHGPPPMKPALAMIAEMCRGLEHAHRHHVLHRDIKPSNLMLTP